MKIDLSNPETHPQQGSWVWRSDNIPCKVKRRFSKLGDTWITLSTPSGDLTVPLDRITGWADWQSDQPHIYMCDVRLKGTDRTYKLLELFDNPFPAGIKAVYDTWAKLESIDGSVAYWRIDQLEYCDRSVLSIPQSQPITEAIAA